MPSLVLDIHLTAEQFLTYYQGRTNRVLAYSRDGRSVSLPTHHLRPFLTHDGVRGTFQLDVGPDGKLLGVKRLG